MGLGEKAFSPSLFLSPENVRFIKSMSTKKENAVYVDMVVLTRPGSMK